jgi:hypothetical protein
MYISIEPTDAEQVLHSASYEQRLQAVLFSLGVCASQCRASARYAKQVPPCSSAVPRSAGLRKEASFITKQFFAVLASKAQSVCCSICLPIPYRMGKTKRQWLTCMLFRLAIHTSRSSLGLAPGCLSGLCNLPRLHALHAFHRAIRLRPHHTQSDARHGSHWLSPFLFEPTPHSLASLWLGSMAAQQRA